MTSVVLLTYNSAKYINPLIESIFEKNKDEKFEIIVVDNKSTDNTVKEVQKIKAKSQDNKRRIKILETGSNLGFAGGINLGSHQAAGEYLLFVNPDTLWRGGSIKDLISVFSKNEKIGIVGGKLVNKDGQPEKSSGKFFTFFPALLISLGLDEKFNVRFSPDKVVQVDFVSGGFMMVKKKLFDKLLGFDRNYFMYVEDMDLCFRAKNAGFLTYFTPEVVLMHDAHGSGSRGFAIENIYKGIMYFQKLYMSKLSYLTIRLVLYLKAVALVFMGKIINNKYLSETYGQALKSF